MTVAVNVVAVVMTIVIEHITFCIRHTERSQHQARSLKTTTMHYDALDPALLLQSCRAPCCLSCRSPVDASCEENCRGANGTSAEEERAHRTDWAAHSPRELFLQPVAACPVVTAEGKKRHSPALRVRLVHADLNRSGS